MNKVYVSGALTNVQSPVALKAFYEKIGVLCKNMGFQAYVPHQYTDPLAHPHISPNQVFATDKAQVSISDLVIAYLGSQSFGVGMELAYAEINEVSVILLYERGKRISRAVHGIPTIIAEIQFDDYEDALRQLKNVLEKIKLEGLITQKHLSDSLYC